jgi:hypothetical protein
MSIFEYVMVLVSVVIGLGMARLLETHASLLKLGPRVRWSPTWLQWLVIIFLFHIDLWASLWQLHAAGRWNWTGIAASLACAVFLFYAAHLSAPEVAGDDAIDLWEFHLANRRRYLTAIIGYAVVGMFLNATLMRAAFSAANLTTAAPGMVLFLTALFVPNRWVQIAIPPLALGLLAFYFAQYLPTLG